MAGKYYVIAIVLFLTGCAQVGTISGGSKDIYAPRPIEDAISPPNASTNFTGNQITIPFDEYFTLTNPVQTIQMVPPHAKIQATVKKKTLILSWEESLQPNTTYAIYLNKTVKDLTEKNDSTMQFVFSTGNQIDTMSYSFAVMDAWTQEPEKNALAVLYDEKDELVSIAQVSDGIASMNYLREGSYRLVVIDDENGNMTAENSERIAFPEGGNIRVNNTFFDSIPFRMFLPEQPLKVEATPMPPCGMWVVSNKSLMPKTTSVSFVPDIPNTPFFLDKDTVLVFSKDVLPASGKIALYAGNESDTVNYRLQKSELESPIRIKPRNAKKVLPGENLQFMLNSEITAIDREKIRIVNLEDSTLIDSFSVEFAGPSFRIKLDKNSLSQINVSIPEGTVHTVCGDAVEGNFNMTLVSLKDLGELVIDLGGYDDPLLIVELLKDGKNVRTEMVALPETILTVSELDPGNYSFRVIRDLNGNMEWDTGDLELLRQPEPIDLYSKNVKLRPSWTVEVTLNPSEKTP